MRVPWWKLGVSMEKTNVIAVMGSPSSGKTMTSLKLATELTGHKKSVIVVTLDGNCPVIPYVMPSNLVHELSFGEVFQKNKMEEAEIHSTLFPVPNHTFLHLVGYRLAEKKYVLSEEEMMNFLSLLQPMADHIILDCTSDLEDIASKIAIELADIVFQLGTASTKGLSYYANADKLYQMKGKGMFIVSNLKKGQDLVEISKAYGTVDYVLPYCDELERQLLEVDLFSPLKEPLSRAYRSEIQKIVADVFKLFPEKKVKLQNRPWLYRVAHRIFQGEGKGEF